MLTRADWMLTGRGTGLVTAHEQYLHLRLFDNLFYI
jgi:hypothetical protein